MEELNEREKFLIHEGLRIREDDLYELLQRGGISKKNLENQLNEVKKLREKIN